jgi:hypothetical protein
MREIRANEGLAFRRKLARLSQVVAYLQEAIAEQLYYLVVAVLKFAQDMLEHLDDFFIRKRHCARNNSARNLFGGGMKRAQ